MPAYVGSEQGTTELHRSDSAVVQGLLLWVASRRLEIDCPLGTAGVVLRLRTTGSAVSGSRNERRGGNATGGSQINETTKKSTHGSK